ncbi:hypothetical protein RA8CHR_04233 [Variovorax sp. RA8]|nr:hypothetical protein RA8CHR_04233 [Variovorax sp. RA8]
MLSLPRSASSRHWRQRTTRCATTLHYSPFDIAAAQLCTAASRAHPASRRRTIQSIGEPLLQVVDAQHRLEAERRAAGLRARVVRCHDLHQRVPRHHAHHLLQKLALARPLRLQIPSARPAAARSSQDLDRQVEELEDKIDAWHRSSDLRRKLAMGPGIGSITASALVASIGDATRSISIMDGRIPRACWVPSLLLQTDRSPCHEGMASPDAE